ncbi:MAG: RagB/SusD family nutrient uptake outer membrane protein [Tannerella sp.]|jgi:hypothetical protein|nr:RagB/SusD family nutrient uptake outer membrane protein [Tannerella sp.]
MKKISLLIIITLLHYSCKNFLEEELISGISYEYYNTEKGLKDLPWSCYTPLRYIYYTEDAIQLTLFGTDTWRDVGAGNARMFHRYESTLDANLSSFHNVWTEYYSAINSCNIAANRIFSFQGGTDFLKTENDKRIRESEARFLRAYYYFFLVQEFGKIPLSLEENISVKTDIKRADVADVYKAIIGDLIYAQQYLPDSPSDYGRATKGAALHLLSKAYLTRGSAVSDQRGQQASDIDSAAYYADQLINSGQYELLNDFADVFDPHNQKNKEIIFAVQFTTNKLANSPPNTMHRLFLCAYHQFPGILRYLEGGTSGTRLQPTNYLMDVYDRQNDSRFYKQFKTVYLCNNPSAAPKWDADNAPDPSFVGKPKFGAGDTALVFSMDKDVPDDVVAKRPYHWLPRNKFTELYFIPTQLHLDPDRDGIESTAGTRDWFLMRLAETYLIAAEAYGRKGNYSKALEYINKIRERASYKENEEKPSEYYKVEGGSINDLYKSTKEEMLATLESINSPEKIRDFILDERARELNSECQRWFDLVRTETFLDRVRKFNPNAAPNVKEYHKLRPIPQAHIDRLSDPGSASEEQNEGYY